MPARLRLLSLWLAHTLYMTAATVVVINLVSNPSLQQLGQVVWLVPWIAAGIVLSVFGSLLPLRWGLAGACAVGAVGAALVEADVAAHLIGYRLAAFAFAFAGPLLLAVLPPAAADARVTLNRVYAGFAVGALLGMAGGWFLTGPWPGHDVVVMSWIGLTPSLLSLAAAVLVTLAKFPSEHVQRPFSGPAYQAMLGGIEQLWGHHNSGADFTGMTAWRLLAWGLCILLSFRFLPPSDEGSSFSCLTWFLSGLAVGSLLTLLQPHPRRSLGLIPLSATALVVLLLWVALSGPSRSAFLLLGALVSLGDIPLVCHFLREATRETRINGVAFRGALEVLVVAALWWGLAVWSGQEWFAGATPLWIAVALTGMAAVLAWRLCYREFLEMLTTVVLWPVYRVRGGGPGRDKVPERGPFVLIANHSAWFDPVWLGMVLPRRLKPMMTSSFYDLRVLNWLVKYVVKAIRVQDSGYRREAPELRQAVAALDSGEVLLIFPEGRLRRTAERPLHPFGQGIWHILRERPDTPVIACWIEGGWGSYFSHFKGRPTKNKWFDFWRTIRVAVGEPEVLPAEVLADRRATRRHLMQRCLEGRGYLGLEVYPLPEMREETAKGEDELE